MNRLSDMVVFNVVIAVLEQVPAEQVGVRPRHAEAVAQTSREVVAQQVETSADAGEVFVGDGLVEREHGIFSSRRLNYSLSGSRSHCSADPSTCFFRDEHGVLRASRARYFPSASRGDYVWGEALILLPNSAGACGAGEAAILPPTHLADLAGASCCRSLGFAASHCEFHSLQTYIPKRKAGSVQL